MNRGASWDTIRSSAYTLYLTCIMHLHKYFRPTFFSWTFSNQHVLIQKKYAFFSFPFHRRSKLKLQFTFSLESRCGVTGVRWVWETKYWGVRTQNTITFSLFYRTWIKKTSLWCIPVSFWCEFIDLVDFLVLFCDPCHFTLKTKSRLHRKTAGVRTMSTRRRFAARKPIE